MFWNDDDQLFLIIVFCFTNILSIISYFIDLIIKLNYGGKFLSLIMTLLIFINMIWFYFYKEKKRRF